MKLPLAILVLGFLPQFCAADPLTTSVDERIETGVEHILANISEPSIPDRWVDVTEVSGLRPDPAGTTDFQAAIEAVFDKLEAAGGGHLLIPYPGGWREGAPEMVYRVRGPINLRSNCALVLDRGIKLFFEFDPPAYRPGGKGVLTRYEGTLLYTHSPLIRAFNIDNFAVLGRGEAGPLPVIDGDGSRWRQWEVAGNRERGNSQDGKHASYQLVKEVNNDAVPVPERRFDEEFLRPSILQIFISRRGLVEGVKFENSPFWVVHPVFSENLVFRGIDFRTLGANNDGIDPESSRYVLIENVNFHNGDDCIAIKSGRDLEGREGAVIAGTELQGIESSFIRDGRIGGPTSQVLIRNNTFRGHYAICIGSEMSGGAHHIFALDNSSSTEVRMGFYIKGGRNRGGVASDVYVRGMHLNEVKREVVRLIPNYDNDLVSPWPSKFKNIHIEDMTVKHAERGIRVFGWPDATIDDVTLKNISVGSVTEEPPLQYNNVHNLVLENVILNGQDISGRFDQIDPEQPMPR